MSTLKFGCQTYSWQMSYDTYSQRLDHIIKVAAEAGFTGIEPEVCMLGAYRMEPERLLDTLEAHALHLGALCLVCDWCAPRETEAERIEADCAITFLKNFPGTLLTLCQMPGKDRDNLHERQQHCLACITEVAHRAAKAGIATAFHPNSPPGSVFRVEEDYRLLLDALESSVLGFAPDTGHIARGGMNPHDIFHQYTAKIHHVHYKDMTADRNWIEMGRGVIDFPLITADLHHARYSGWIMVEDESPAAETDPDGVTRRNGQYIHERLYAKG